MPAQGHYPQQVPIDAYGNGGFRFAGMSHRGSLLCLPSGMHAWSVSTAVAVTADSLTPVFALADAIDVLLVGTGKDIILLDPQLRQALRDRQILAEAISTGSALRTYNMLLAENRAVAAALLAVDSVR